MRLLHVVGARPNFMKIAPVWCAIKELTPFKQVLVHTGQHYDINMSDVFFVDLGLPTPDYCLGIGSRSHAQQTAAIMLAFEPVVQEVRPDLVLVYGDVNSTLAAALVCAKLGVAVAHVEAGLRSFDRSMPEEFNRLLTDQIADLLFTPSPDGDENLLREGIIPNRIHRVGNVMIDSLLRLLPLTEGSTALKDIGLQAGNYAVLTLHRPANVDDDLTFSRLLVRLVELSDRLLIVFPIHPRTKGRLASLNLSINSNLRVVDPLGYLDFLQLVRHSRVAITDSGGIQEETSTLGIPCLTLRSNTERPITVEMGTNTLVGSDVELLIERFHAVVDGDNSWDRRPATGIPLWDGHAGERIAAVLAGCA
ncbi:MAG: UDP-N-acetylglucosamine 2-epimerase (non-hydrolyzing) [Acidobacteria bacterium]|nr:UDP-N-acetylglucosamine 2-epimerase (non-hydrolyzing) [Acidobacteriota bacterium]